MSEFKYGGLHVKQVFIASSYVDTRITVRQRVKSYGCFAYTTHHSASLGDVSAHQKAICKAAVSIRCV